MYTTWTKKELPIQVYAAIYVMETTVQVGITLMRRHWFIRMNETPWRPRILPFQSDKVVRRDLVLGFPILTLHRLRLHNCTSIEESERKIGPWKRLQRLTRSSNAFRCRRYVTESAVKKKNPVRSCEKRKTSAQLAQLGINCWMRNQVALRSFDAKKNAGQPSEKEIRSNLVPFPPRDSGNLIFFRRPHFGPFPLEKKIVKSF